MAFITCQVLSNDALKDSKVVSVEVPNAVSL